MEIKVNGIETPDGNINTFIPPSPTETVRGGIKAKAKTNETVEVVVGSNGKLYVPTYPSIDKALTSSGSAADAKVVGDKLTEVNTEITALKKSVSDGKEMLAVAITEKGIETASNDSFSTMAENIDSIKALLLQPYIVGNATGYFDTGLLFSDLTKVEIDFMYMNTVRDGNSIFGIGENGTYLGSDTRSNGYMGIYYGSGANTKVVSVDAIENDLRFNRVVFDNVSKTITMNGTNVTSISARTYSPTIPIFAMHDEVFRAFPRSSDAKLYAFRIFDNDIVLRDYVPAKDADGVVCLRDRISGAYLYDATGTNTFGYGEEYVIYKGEL